MATFTHHKDILIECPFDKNHKIAVRNQIKHIIDCEKKISGKFSVCIYNASHRMARHEFAKHIKSCPDGRQDIRAAYESKKTNMSEVKPEMISNNTIECQIPCNSEKIRQLEDNTDDWDNDNFPQFSIYQTNDSEVNNLPQIKTQLTKNQKKRNRKKASIDSQKTNSIWD